MFASINNLYYYFASSRILLLVFLTQLINMESGGEERHKNGIQGDLQNSSINY